MFKLMIILAVAILAISAAPAPIPPVISHPLIYPESYVKVLPLHPATLPLSYHHGYKWLHPGSVYLY
ncbi:uncharacterized protein LOC143305860 [Osmia lignaria lignaria]|uniref:uncharacterized protein LOC143305860 n=1 Tax=Osmia lignaria lignaria TaxID=1437193 RepID=UPI00402B9DB1